MNISYTTHTLPNTSRFGAVTLLSASENQFCLRLTGEDIRSVAATTLFPKLRLQVNPHPNDVFDVTATYNPLEPEEYRRMTCDGNFYSVRDQAHNPFKTIPMRGRSHFQAIERLAGRAPGIEQNTQAQNVLGHLNRTWGILEARFRGMLSGLFAQFTPAFTQLTGAVGPAQSAHDLVVEDLAEDRSQLGEHLNGMQISVVAILAGAKRLEPLQQSLNDLVAVLKPLDDEPEAA